VFDRLDYVKGMEKVLSEKYTSNQMERKFSTTELSFKMLYLIA
jgi:hypothetical protein